MGPFAIQFFWERLSGALNWRCFDVVALEPNPSGASEDVTHPHVRHGKLCAGDATAPLQKALGEGRLADAFQLIRGVLLTYNPDSPYAPLETWEGARCHDCGYTAPADELRYCEACGHDYCEECASSCGSCSETRCTGCLERCAVCQDCSCGGCLEETTASERGCCLSCRRTCGACAAVFAGDEAADNSTLCPACRTEPAADDPPAPIEPTSPETVSASPVTEPCYATSLELSAALPAPASTLPDV